MKRKATLVEQKDVKDAYSLFYDVKRSQKFIESYEKDFMFSGEEDQVDGDSAAAQMDLS